MKLKHKGCYFTKVYGMPCNVLTKRIITRLLIKMVIIKDYHSRIKCKSKEE